MTDRAAAPPARQDADGGLRDRRRCCSAWSSSSSPSACGTRSGRRSSRISNRPSGCLPPSKRGASASCAAQAETLADNATLKAALDTYQSETQANRDDGRAPICSRRSTSCSRGSRHGSSPTRSCSWTAARSRSRRPDAWRTAGREAGRCRSSRAQRPAADSFDGVAHMGDNVFRVVTVPLLLDDATIGTLYVATSLDQDYAAGARPPRRHAHRDRQRRARRGDHARRRARRAQFESAVAVGAAGRRDDRARRRIVRVPAARRGRRYGVLRARFDRRVVAGRDARRHAQPRAHRRPRHRARRHRQLLAGADAERADRPAFDVARRDGGVPRRPRAAAADRVEPRARRRSRKRSTI